MKNVVTVSVSFTALPLEHDEDYPASPDCQTNKDFQYSDIVDFENKMDMARVYLCSLMTAKDIRVNKWSITCNSHVNE